MLRKLTNSRINFTPCLHYPRCAHNGVVELIQLFSSATRAHALTTNKGLGQWTTSTQALKNFMRCQLQSDKVHLLQKRKILPQHYQKMIWHQKFMHVKSKWQEMSWTIHDKELNALLDWRTVIRATFILDNIFSYKNRTLQITLNFLPTKEDLHIIWKAL